VCGFKFAVLQYKVLRNSVATYSINTVLKETFSVIHSRRRQKQFGGEGRTKFSRIFFTCPNMTNLIGKIQIVNELTIPESKAVSPKKGLHQEF